MKLGFGQAPLEILLETAALMLSVDTLQLSGGVYAHVEVFEHPVRPHVKVLGDPV